MAAAAGNHMQTQRPGEPRLLFGAALACALPSVPAIMPNERSWGRDGAPRAVRASASARERAVVCGDAEDLARRPAPRSGVVVRVLRRALLAVGVAGLIATVLRVRGRGGVPPQRGGWQEVPFTERP